MEKKCIECQDTFRGRADKKFCSDLCRNSYNNKLNSDYNNHVRNVNNILRRNRRILEELVPRDRATASRSRLLQKGFDLNYFTNTQTSRNGTTFYFCYDYGYQPMSEEQYILIKKRE